ncbi:hypothetical protein SELMODRAFT_420422 [Selaginella moellendorffii]|uniref:Uncharacterized protein n=1 Tax=Selaginella moellendorffii TaxID=88036 RepID=D8SBY3_SELML|nr:hypothetical protein SELMODRAFT_420422 [Selaginella moellendorffii]
MRRAIGTAFHETAVPGAPAGGATGSGIGGGAPAGGRAGTRECVLGSNTYSTVFLVSAHSAAEYIQKFYYIVMKKKKKKKKQRQELAAWFASQREERSENVKQMLTFLTQKKHQRNPGVDDEDNHLWTIRSHEKEIRAALSATSEAVGSRGTNVKSQAYEEVKVLSSAFTDCLLQRCKPFSIKAVVLANVKCKLQVLDGLAAIAEALWQQVVIKAIDNCFCRGTLSITDAAGTVVVTACIIMAYARDTYFHS